jgi:hypothetical protein
MDRGDGFKGRQFTAEVILWEGASRHSGHEQKENKRGVIHFERRGFLSRSVGYLQRG